MCECVWRKPILDNTARQGREEHSNHQAGNGCRDHGWLARVDVLVS